MGSILLKNSVARLPAAIFETRRPVCKMFYYITRDNRNQYFAIYLPPDFFNSIGRQRNCERKIGPFGEPPSALPIEAELRIADQYFSSAKERSPAINVRGYRGGSSQRGTKIISHTVLRIIKRAARPLALGAWLQTPNYREAAEVPLP